MKNVLFQVATEFHYMISCSIIDKFYDPSKFNINIVICSRNTSRLSTLNFDKRFNYIIVKYDHSTNEQYPDIMKLMEFIYANKFYSFYSFLYHDPLFICLSSYLKKRGTKVSLVPDGMGAYVKYSDLNFRSRYINTINTYRFFKKHQIKFNRFWFTNWNFGKNGYYDQIIAFSKELPFISSKKISELDYTLSQDALVKLKKSFNVDFSNYPTLNKTVLIINDRVRLPNYEIELVKAIKKFYPGHTILCKKHPNQINSSNDVVYDDVFVIEEIFPVELLIASLTNSVIFSLYSNSMLYHNPSCLYFFGFTIGEKFGEYRNDILREVPKAHINVLEGFDDLLSYSEGK